MHDYSVKVISRRDGVVSQINGSSKGLVLNPSKSLPWWSDLLFIPSVAHHVDGHASVEFVVAATSLLLQTIRDICT